MSIRIFLIDEHLPARRSLVRRRALAAKDQTTVAILTSYLDPDERRQAYQAGVSGYLLKEVDTDNPANWIRLAVYSRPGDCKS